MGFGHYRLNKIYVQVKTILLLLRVFNRMTFQDNTDEITLYLTQTLDGYEVIPANFGWHIHKGDTYCGLLEYQEAKGWQGNALNCLPAEMREQLKKAALGSYLPQAA